MKIEKKEVIRCGGSLKKSEITGTIETVETLKDIESPGFRVALISAFMQGQAVFVVASAYWSYEDAEEDFYIFTDKAKAQKVYNELATGKVKETETRPYRVFYKNGDKAKTVFGTNWNGYFVQSRHNGELLVPYFDGVKLGEEGKILAKSLDNDNEEIDIRNLKENYHQLFSCVLRVGDNERVTVLSTDEENINAHTKEIFFARHYCWETGLNYYRLANKVPKEIFKLLGLQYHSEQEEEEGEWVGWYTMNPQDIKNKVPADWSVHY
jgi:hypothetical protein